MTHQELFRLPCGRRVLRGLKCGRTARRRGQGASASRRLHAERTEPQTQLSTEDNVGVIVITILLREDQPGLEKRNDFQP